MNYNEYIMSHTEFQILLRKPKYPLIVISAENIYSAFNIKKLAQSYINSNLLDHDKYVKAIDSTGEEFWYSPQYSSLTPGFFSKRWSKMRIIDVYNESSNSKISEHKYSVKSLSTKRLERVVLEICNLLK